jgi:hypothetical protein
MRSMFGLCGLLVGCSPAGLRDQLVLPDSTVDTLVIVEAAGRAPRYRVLSPGGHVDIEPGDEDVEVTAAAYDFSLAGFGVVGLAGLLIADSDTPTSRTAPLPLPLEWWTGELGGTYTRHEPAAWATARPEQLALSDCPRYEPATPLPLGHSHPAPVFLSPSVDEDWVIAPAGRSDGNQYSRAYRCTVRCDQIPELPRDLPEPVGALDADGTPWWVDAPRGRVMRGLAGGGSPALTLPTAGGVSIVGLALTPGLVGVLDADDQLHVYDRAQASWRAPRGLSPLSTQSATTTPCRVAPSTRRLWLDEASAGVALLAGACRWVEFDARAVTSSFPTSAATGLAYARDGAVEALIAERADGVARAYRRDAGGPWELLEFDGRVGATSPGSEGLSVVVVGQDVVTVDDSEKTQELMINHRWATHPGRELRCPGEALGGVRALARRPGGLVAIRLEGDPKLYRITLGTP